MLSPATCLVLDDGDGHAVGYLLGIPDTLSFVKSYRETYIPYLKTEGLEKPGPGEPTEWNENLPNALRKLMYSPEGMLHENYPQLMEEWPAHMHIDILPEFQKRGYGRQLIEAFCRLAKGRGAKGVHLLMAASNVDAGKFYGRTGFTRFPCVLDNGVSGEEGRDQNTIWFVKSL